jgi:hypothetical protein
MPSVTIRQLRNTKQIKFWLQAGEKIELHDRNRVIGRIIPEHPAKLAVQPVEWPDFAARAREIFGDRSHLEFNAVLKAR